MNGLPGQPNARQRTVEPLPADFPPELAELDSLLADEAGRSPIPPDLTRNIHARSRVYLPRASAAPQPLRAMEPARMIPVPRSMRARLGGQLAMAASLGMAFIITGLFMKAPVATTEVPDFNTTMVSRLQEVGQTWLDNPGYDLEYLDNTRELSSVDEVVGPLWAELEGSEI